MNARTPVPLRPDRDSVRRGVLKTFTRAVVGHLSSSDGQSYPADFAQEKWPHDSDCALAQQGRDNPHVDHLGPELVADFEPPIS